MVIRIKKKEKAKQHNKVKSVDSKVKSDFVHFIARKTYYKGLIRGGSAIPSMEPCMIDSNCALYKPIIKEALSVLIEEGFLILGNLNIPQGQTEKAEDA